MRESCPEPEEWISWWRGRLDPGGVDRSRLLPHLADCPECRQELASLVAAADPLRVPPAFLTGIPEPVRPRRLPYALAAGFLLTVVAFAAWRSGSVFAPALPSPPVRAPKAAIPLVEWMVGGSGEVCLSPGSSARMEGGELLLSRGEARVETAGDPVRVSVGGWRMEVSEGEAVFRAPLPALSLWISAAWAGEVKPPVTVIRGEVRIVSGPMQGKVLRPAPGEAVPDPRGWRSLDAAAGAWKDGTRVLLPEAPAFTAEVLVRKKIPTAEAFLLFRAAGKGWQAPLGVYLPASGAWVRVRLEVRDERVRVVAAGQEYFSASPATLGARVYSWEGSEALALRAWGGGLEIREARWRP